MAVRVLIVDNYDSFTYNLVQQLGEMGAELDVRRNDATTVAEVRAAAPDAIVISPGPGRPEAAGITCELIAELGGEIPLLGVCLGHQAIGQVFGAAVVAAPTLMHGKTSEVHHRSTGVFAGLPEPLVATRYHSLVLDPGSIPDVLEVTAETADGVIMGVEHRELPIHGVQFHPESILSPDGPRLLARFLEIAGG